MADFRSGGWVKEYRRIEYSPVYRNIWATRVFQWMIRNARWCDGTEIVPGGILELRRGQLHATYQEIAVRNHMSKKQARDACAFLQKLACIDWEKCGKGMLVTVINYEHYQGGDDEAAEVDVPSLHGDPGVAPAAGGHDSGHDLGHDAGHDAGTMQMVSNTSAGNDLSERGNCARARSGHGTGHDGGHETGHDQGEKLTDALCSPSTRARAGDTVVEETKKLINPPYPPFSKGGLVCENSSPSSTAMLGTPDERYRMVLDMWREQRLAAGLDYQEDSGTVAGARIIADDYLGQAALSFNRLEAGMHKLIARIKSDSKCAGYTLRALARNPSSYCPGPPVVTPKRVFVRWPMVCGVCGYTLHTEWKSEGTAPPTGEPCARATVRKGGGFEYLCQGWMEPGEMEILER